MSRNLKIDVGVSDTGELQIIDHTDYRQNDIDSRNYVIIDFIIDSKDSDNLEVTDCVSKPMTQVGTQESEVEFPYDGTFSFYRLVVPTLRHFESANSSYSTMSNQLVFFDGLLYVAPELDDTPYAVQDIIGLLTKTDDLLDIYDKCYMNEYEHTLFSLKLNIFNLANFKSILFQLQKKLLFTFDDCVKSTDIIKRDFLLSSLYVFEYLLKIGNLSEAQTILDNLTSCASFMNSTTKTCNCGKAK